MLKPSLFRPDQLRRIAPVGSEAGLVSATRPHLFEDGAGNRYVGKELSNPHRFLIVNEVVSANLASLLGLRTPGHHVRMFRGRPVFLSEWVGGRTFYSFGPDALRDLLEPWEDVLVLTCLDRLIINEDRHLNNVIFERHGERYRLCAIDHDKTLFGISSDTASLQRNHLRACSDVGHPNFGHLLKAMRPRRSDFLPCLQRVKDLSDDLIRGAVEDDLLADHLDDEDCEQLVRVLLARRDDVARCVSDAVKVGCYQGTLVSEAS